MVKAMINISKEANQVLNVVKAKYDLKDKSEAIDKVVIAYGDKLMQPELRPEYVEKLQRIKKEKGTRFKNVSELRKHIENA